MKSYTIHLIRNGMTRGNEEGRYIGTTDLPLSPAGEKRLNTLAKKYPYPQADLYYTSPLLRCTQTIKILYPEAKPTLMSGLCECDFGEWEGKTAAEISAHNPAFARWVSGEGRQVTPPGGENGVEMMRRVCASFERIVHGMMINGTASAVIVAHGGALMSILTAYGLPRAQFYDWMTESGCGYSVRITPGLWMRSKVVEVYAKIPEEKKKDQGNGVMLIDLAREAAERAYGKKEKNQKDS